MSDISSAVQRWDEWQLRILVLCSLGFQWFLLLLIPMRNYTIQRWIRSCIRLACICADVLAIYALATLLCRQAAGRWIPWISSSFDDEAQQWRSLMLEALWAPLLLVHLAGREELTANDMEGTAAALWVRHAAVLVTVTVYAFSTSLRYFSDNSDGFRLMASAALLLVAAVVSSCGKPWVLRRASVRRLVAKSSLAKGARRTTTTTKKKQHPACSGWWEWCFTELGDRYKCWKELKPRGTAPMLSQGDKVQMLLSGMSLHAARATLETRKKKPEQKILEPLKPWRREQHALEPSSSSSKVDMIMKPRLRQAFGLIYTRATAMFTPAYLACHALLVPSLYLAAVVLFFFAVSYKKHGYSRYSRADVNTTYVLLCFTAALDVLGMFVSELIYSLMSSSFGTAAACENLPGHNLMDSVLWTIRRPIVSMLLLRCYKGGLFVTDGDGLYGSVLEFVTNELKLVDKGEGKDFDDLDFSSYRSLNKKSNWILRDEKLRAACKNNKNIWDSLRKKPFDESVLVWHIATDLCFRAKPPNFFHFRPPPEGVKREVCTEAISNYMAYLLDRRPEMLMAGSRQQLFAEAMANMELVVREATEGLRPKLREKQPLDDAVRGKIKEGAARLAKDKDAYTVKIKQEAAGANQEAGSLLKDDKEPPYTIIYDACKLAEELLGIEKDDERWDLMHRVWVGMLCYSASMCMGDLHAKSLGEGGEFLSSVWLLISLIGGRNLADKLQMPDDEDTEPEDNVVETPPARDNKGAQKPEAEAAGNVQTPDTEPKDNLSAANLLNRLGFHAEP